MTYAGTNRGGTAAILAAEGLLHAHLEQADGLSSDAVLGSFAALADRVMGEAGLWDPEAAAAALVQAGGDAPEAVHLLRARRATLPRLAVSDPITSEQVQLVRRISSTTREPDGPQLLGATPDYTARIIRRAGEPSPLPLEVAEDELARPADWPERPYQRYSELLRERDLLVDRRDDSDPEPYDLALHPPTLPAPRSEWLSAMALAETGGLVGLWYRSILGPDGYTDESVTLGDVRRGRVLLRVRHPYLDDADDPAGGEAAMVGIGEIRVSECESVAHLDSRGEDTARFEVGYGLVLGDNERKAITMSILDLAALRAGDTEEGRQLQQLLVWTLDGLASNGFLEHLKLPHYVTFRSMVERAEAARDRTTAAAGQQDEQQGGAA